MEKQTEFDFDSLAAEPDELEVKPETELDYSKKPGAFVNAHGILVTDDDIPF